jgi:hypothetical protein
MLVEAIQHPVAALCGVIILVAVAAGVIAKAPR